MLAIISRQSITKIASYLNCCCTKRVRTFLQPNEAFLASTMESSICYLEGPKRFGCYIACTVSVYPYVSDVCLNQAELFAQMTSTEAQRNDNQKIHDEKMLLYKNSFTTTFRFLDFVQCLRIDIH
jgi:hypothetical protein